MKRKTMMITGGSDGLGKIVAQHFKNKYKVIIISPSKDKLKKVAVETGVECKVCDVSVYKQCQKITNEVIQKFGSVDVLINSAGLWIQGKVDENKPDEIKRVIEVNTLGVIYMTKAVIPQMKNQKMGTIININSQAGLYPKEERAVYNLTKWGLTGFTKSLQPELARYGIRVTDIHPGKMKTNMFEKMGIHKDMSDSLEPEHVSTLIEVLLNLPNDVCIPELGIKYLTN